MGRVCAPVGPDVASAPPVLPDPWGDLLMWQKQSLVTFIANTVPPCLSLASIIFLILRSSVNTAKFTEVLLLGNNF